MELLKEVQAAVDRPPAQTSRNREIPTYMPPATATAEKVYIKVAKKSPLSPIWDGPYPIKERIGKSCLKLITGHYANGRERTEVRHWRTCFPADPADDTPVAQKPLLGRKPTRLNADAREFVSRS